MISVRLCAPQPLGRILFIAEFVKTGDLEDLPPRGFKIYPLEPRQRPVLHNIRAFQHFHTQGPKPLRGGKDIVHFKTEVHASNFRRPLQRLRTIVTAVLKEFNACAIPATQENEVTNVRVRRRTELALHEVHVNVKGSGAEHFNCTENCLKERDAFVNIRHSNSDMMHSVDLFCHSASPQ